MVSLSLVPSLVESSVSICFCSLLSTTFATSFLATPYFPVEKRLVGLFGLAGVLRFFLFFASVQRFPSGAPDFLQLMLS